MVKCPYCGGVYEKLNPKHINTHGFTMYEFMLAYPKISHNDFPYGSVTRKPNLQDDYLLHLIERDGMIGARGL